MPPINPFPVLRSLSLRSRPASAFRVGIQRPAVYRSYANNASTNDHNYLPKAENQEGTGPNMQQAEHVSEEAAKMAKMQGGEGPDMSQGTPVQEVRYTPNTQDTITALTMYNRS
jgi:small subunit ribosomal protein S7